MSLMHDLSTDYILSRRRQRRCDGEAKVVVQDIASCEQTQETMALLKILALGSTQVEEGRMRPAAEVIERLRRRRSID